MKDPFAQSNLSVYDALLTHCRQKMRLIFLHKIVLSKVLLSILPPLAFHFTNTVAGTSYDATCTGVNRKDRKRVTGSSKTHWTRLSLSPISKLRLLLQDYHMGAELWKILSARKSCGFPCMTLWLTLYGAWASGSSIPPCKPRSLFHQPACLTQASRGLWYNVRQWMTFEFTFIGGNFAHWWHSKLIQNVRHFGKDK